MADSEDAPIIRAIIKECLRKLHVLGWCTKNKELHDATQAYSIAQLLQDRSEGLKKLLCEQPDEEDDQARSISSESSTESFTLAAMVQVSSASGEDRKYYDRFEYLERAKEVTRLRSRLRLLKSKCHAQNQKLHHESQIAMMKHRFVEHWEAARNEQLQRLIHDEVGQLSEKLTVKRRENEQANEAVAATARYYQWKLAQINQQIEGWMTRFDSDKDDQDTRFQKARATEKRWKELREQYERQENTITRLQQELTRWKLEEQHKQYCILMATKLQAWWRGTMVRKGLGRFGSNSKKNRTKKEPTKNAKAKGKKK
ncbi:dynein regulatory complex protein 9-like [Anopheles aquasalis]|uniref:dynein regulatory complex protein 9-like n=1 Tax=Anopheles aquasalis TaxID=42839 RepID=UPI00215A1BED|nr:dynein regulatory complex protein 9-like [Anopheles aquasalis]